MIKHPEPPEHPEPERGLTEEWDARYAATDRVWSGNPNAALVDTVSSLTPNGRALDVGCGEGADVLWLAAQGWEAEGIDLSQVAISRARSHAQAAATSAQFHTSDVGHWASAHREGYTLVSAAFLHTHGGDDRAALLRHAASMVAPGGRLFILSHASPPPWARSHAPDRTPGTPELDRDLAGVTTWMTEVAETRTRAAVGPDGTEATLEDSILLVQRPVADAVTD